MMISLTFGRAGIGQPDLVVTDDPTQALYLPEDALGEITRGFRKEYAPDSPWIGGRMLLSAVEAECDVPVTIYARGATTSALVAAKAELQEAVTQFEYPLTITVDGEVSAFSAECSIPRWGPFDSGMVRAHLARASWSIPVNPI